MSSSVLGFVLHEGIDREEPRPKLKLAPCEKCGGMRMQGGVHAMRIIKRGDEWVRVDCVGDEIK